MTQTSFKGITEMQITHAPIGSLYPLRDGGLMSTSANLGYRQKIATVWNPSTGLEKLTLNGHNKYLTQVCQLKNGLVATASHGNTIILWDVEQQQSDKQQQVLVLKDEYNEFVSYVCPLSNGHLASGFSCNVIIWNSNTGKQTSTLRVNGGISSLLQLNDGLLAVGSDDETIWLKNLETGQSVMALKEPIDDRIHCMCHLQDDTLISGSGRTINMWDVRSGKCSMTLEGPALIWSLCPLYDGRFLSASDDDTVIVWNVQTGKNEMTFERGHTVCQLINETVAIGNFNGEIDLLK